MTELKKKEEKRLEQTLASAATLGLLPCFDTSHYHTHKTNLLSCVVQKPYYLTNGQTDGAQFVHRTLSMHRVGWTETY
ncbi:hypothetical protein GBAR_LOCUS15627 [Geodia barretti]|uniref:Uncharacterized protein n=1 Tax=Geodia barretti TaxID=519541 RepID=A0AA35SES8_GEOBA|nr:hypothetical protein GBAR_LOCUS15627 [Geodia barretti]